MPDRIFAHRRVDVANQVTLFVACEGGSDAATRLTAGSFRANAIAKGAMAIDAVKIG
jgi:hypothetical protein